MILFVPGYDPATRANLAVAEWILPDDCRPLLGGAATRDELLLALAHKARPLFAMSHGRPEDFAEQGGGVAFGLADVQALSHQPVFAFACHTVMGLGKAAAAAGSVWWGYTGAVSTAPDSSPRLLSLFGKVFSYILDSFAEARSGEQRDAVLLRIAELCHEAEEQIDELQESDPDLDAGSALFCLLHIWERLRIWEPGASLPKKHPEAKPPVLFL
ncbi:MAG TPA: hypothetical protein VH988_19975 [Thermoanaerobaculia bacterium]|nr:hypothetical protein [Thermoanaerobaculia bacterium]